MFGISEASHSGLLGKLKLIGTALSMPFFHPISLMNRNRAVFGVNLARFAAQPAFIREWLDEILELIEKGELNPVIDRSFDFAEAAAAHEYIESRQNFGKVVLKVAAP
jgi:NADPH:quinone reductase-like Zn-dependent oxidoreductase